MSNIKPTVSVIILNWNGLKLLKKYFNSLLNQSYKNFEIIFFDNNSQDNSINFIETLKKNSKIKIKIVKNKQNDGTAYASNLAYKYARGKYIFFVSNDMLFDKNLIQRLYNYCEYKTNIGVATVKMLRHISDKKTNIIDSMGANVDILCCADSVNIHKNLKSINDKNDEVFFAFGGALFIKSSIFKKVTGYDERYFTLTDDIDLCWRVRLLGFKIQYINSSYLYHKVSGTLGKTHNRHVKRFFSERNNLCSMIKNYSLTSLFIILPFYLIVSIFESLFFIIFLKYEMSIVPFKAIQWNVQNIKKTLKKRKYIQKNRKVSDFYIFKSMNLVPQKFIYGYEFLFKRKNWGNYMN